MKKSKLFLLSFFITLGIAIYNGQFFQKNLLVHEVKNKSLHKNWKTFEKKTQDTVSINYSTINEIQKVKKEVNYFKRSPSSISNKEKIDNSLKRKILGEESLEKDIEQLEMLNKINPDWKEQLGSELIKFQNLKTKIIIKTENSLIRVNQGKGQFLEQVLITYLFESGKSNSFRALVDSESSEILETWDRTHFEKEHSKIQFSLPRNKALENGIKGN